MTLAELYDEVLMSMGGGLVDVELEMTHVEYAFKKAKRTFKQKGNTGYRRDFIQLSVEPDTKTYSVPSDVNTIVKIIKPSGMFVSGDPFSIATFNDAFGYSSAMSSNNRFDILSRELTLQLIETWQRYLDYEVQFNHDEFTNSLTLFEPPKRAAIWLLDVYRDLTDEEYMDLLWVQNWTIAESKIILGRAYAKFPQLPGPEGSVSLDGNSLAQEGKDEKQALLDDIATGVDGHYDSAWEITFG